MGVKFHPGTIFLVLRDGFTSLYATPGEGCHFQKRSYIIILTILIKDVTLQDSRPTYVKINVRQNK